MKPTTRLLTAIPIGLGLLFVAAAAGCGPVTECGPGTLSQDGTCVAVCTDGTEPDPVSGSCVPVCREGTHREATSGQCIPDSARCPSGAVWDVSASTCVDAAALCAAGTTWVASEARCVSDADLKVPDQVEGDGFNDWVPGKRTCETFSLPALGDTYSVGGRIEPPADKALAADTDCWEFEVSEPTLLRVSADGLGGLAAGFLIYSLDAYDPDRYGLGSTSQHVTRDVFLPAPGRYALVAGDAFNIVLYSGLPRGSEDFGYYIELENRPFPEPVRVTPDEDGVLARGTWSREVPEEGSQLAFYEVAVEELDMVHLGLHADDSQVQQILAGVSVDGRGFAADYMHQPFATAYGRSGNVLLVADYALWLATEDVPYVLTMEPKELTMIEPGTQTVTLSQDAWSIGQPAVSNYVGFRAEVGDVVTVRVHTDSGFTCVSLWTEGFDVYGGDFGCMVISTPVHDGDIRALPASDGLYVMSVLDYAEARRQGSTLLAIPEHEFSLELTLDPQTPIDPQPLETPWSEVVSVTDEAYEQFFSWQPAAGEMFRIEVAALDDLDPRMSFYGSLGWTFFLAEDFYMARDDAFVYRSTDGRPVLMGVSDWDRKGGSFDVSIEPFQPVDVPVERGVVTETQLVVPGSDPAAWYQLDVPDAGVVTLTVAPPPGLDVAILAGLPDLSWADELTLPRLLNDRSGIDAAEVWEQAFTAGPHFFRVVAPDGQPLPAEVTVDVTTTLEGSFPMETERNDSVAAAEPLPFPGVMAGDAASNTDIDWFSFVLESPTTVDVRTRPLDVQFTGGTSLLIVDAEEQVVANEGSVADFPSLFGVSLPAGTFHVRVVPSAAYVLELAESSE